ncbi:predicted protein [Sclerotinia sclerotiorum 1980 UF-70]|uniref:CCHC-type domain-containing protein n=2 Tax=Sclerotinia sclerotiorum (strain ATCC 18683 / 1980 / Ss-1) TaxID=665079 RepID=A7ER69_SCLS1|nr:predicted protein [Sclerotinia sclerotiorum 1980 UF-70]APA13540.1 hypothetical protein sscle_11g083100 [Sclerotinia sclerotiorum 1980 UF-70]EDN91961.1 predicted protein [Sclerotinia sclerotiorum 1980 UF-70]
MGKDKRKNSNSSGSANGRSSPPNNNNKFNKGGNNKGKGNNNGGNGGNQNKGKVPQKFSECRICDKKGHWESDCRNNPGEGKRGKDLPECRECGGNHWEDQCRTWKSKNNDGNNNNNGQQGNSSPVQCLAPTGEDISHFFADGKYPPRPCKTCHVAGHWNNACQKDGFHPVTNPNPSGKKNDNDNGKGVHFSDDQSSGQIDLSFNQYYSPPKSAQYDTPQQVPPVTFGFQQQQQQQQQMQAQYNTQANEQNTFNYPINLSLNSHSPDYLHSTQPTPYQTYPSTPNPSHPDHPDASSYRARYRSTTCNICQTLGHRPNDCTAYLWLLPRNHPSWRPHIDPQHPSNQQTVHPNNYWLGNPMQIPSKSTYIWPHPQNSHQGRQWGENDYEVLDGGKDVWVEEDDREGVGRVRWGMPPGGCGGEEHGSLCRFDDEGDVLMVDILDLEVRRWKGRVQREERTRRAKNWWETEGGFTQF